jgi:hypothetical protein
MVCDKAVAVAIVAVPIFMLAVGSSATANDFTDQCPKDAVCIQSNQYRVILNADPAALQQLETLERIYPCLGPRLSPSDREVLQAQLSVLASGKLIGENSAVFVRAQEILASDVAAACTVTK